MGMVVVSGVYGWLWLLCLVVWVGMVVVSGVCCFRVHGRGRASDRPIIVNAGRFMVTQSFNLCICIIYTFDFFLFSRVMMITRTGS